MQTLTLAAMRNKHPEVFPRLMNHMEQSQCTRCGGRMIEETYIDILSDYEDFQFQAKHCIQCGDVIDPFILLHRLLQEQGMTLTTKSFQQPRHRDNGLVLST